MLLGLLIMDLFVLYPMAEFRIFDTGPLRWMFGLSVLVGSVAVAAQPRVQVGIALMALVVLGLRGWSPGGVWLAVLTAALTQLYLLLVVVVVLRQVFRRGPINAHRVQGAVVAYLLLGIAWAFAYQMVEIIHPSSFRSLRFHPDDPHIPADLVYFSFSTLSTVGYGDIAPLHPAARSIATAEALVGQLFPTVLIARLVAMELESRRQPHSH